MARVVADDGPHPVDRHVGRRVCERRISLGFSQAELAQPLGLTFQQVQKYEKGANRISASKLWDIATFLRVDIDYFFAGLEGSLQGVANESGGVDQDSRPTRYTTEISRLAPRLSNKNQKLALELVSCLAATTGPKSH